MKIKACLLFGIAAVLLTLCCALPAFAAREEVAVFVNGDVLAADVPPFLQNGRTLVPLRAIGEALEFDVAWNEAERTVTISKDGKTIVLQIGSARVLVNGAEADIDVPAAMEDGRTFVPLRFVSEQLGQRVYWVGGEAHVFAEVRTPSPAQTVRVSTAEEFLRAIAPDTRIVLAEGVYNLTEAMERLQPSAYVSVQAVYDGAELVIANVSNLVIEGSGALGSELVVTPRYANVLHFQGCTDIAIKNIKAGHTPEEGSCSGGVIRLDNTAQVTIEACLLYGCGSEAIIAERSSFVRVADTVMEQCTSYLLSILRSSQIFFDNCTFRDSVVYSCFYLYESHGIYFDRCEISNVVVVPTYDPNFMSLSVNSKLYLLNSTLRDNSGHLEPAHFNSMVLEHCTIENNSFDDVMQMEKINAAEVTLEDLSIGGIAAGMSKAEVVAAKGAPLREAYIENYIHAGNAATLFLTYPDMLVGLGGGGIVVSIETESSAYKTPRGIGVGSSREEVVRQYGYSYRHFSQEYTYAPWREDDSTENPLNYTYLALVFDGDAVAKLELRTFFP